MTQDTDNTGGERETDVEAMDRRADEARDVLTACRTGKTKGPLRLAPVTAVLKERDEAQATITRLERERDEARADLTL